MTTFKSETVKLKTKRVFLKKGTCSRTFYYILNREFGYPMDEEERAIDPLAGGLLQQGYQCGMLWGASMAVGAESLRRNGYGFRICRRSWFKREWLWRPCCCCLDEHISLEQKTN